MSLAKCFRSPRCGAVYALRFPTRTGTDFSPASSDFKALGAFFWTFVTPMLPPVSRASVYQIS
jgi:hypothetical protein